MKLFVRLCHFLVSTLFIQPCHEWLLMATRDKPEQFVSWNDSAQKEFGPWNRNKHPEDGDWIFSCIQLMNKNLAPPGDVKKKNLVENWDKPFKTYKNPLTSHDKTTFPSVFWNSRDFWLKNPSQYWNNQPRRATEPMASRFRGVFFGMEI